MSTRRHSLSLLASLVLPVVLQGCATSGPEFKEVAPAKTGRATIYLYRESRGLGSAGSPTIFLNGKAIVDLKNGGYLPIEVEPGPVVLSHRPAYSAIHVIPWIALLTAHARATVDWEKEGAIAMNAEADRSYFVQWVIGYKMYLRSRDEALPVLITTRRLSPAD
jgi:hypothetical protein